MSRYASWSLLLLLPLLAAQEPTVAKTHWAYQPVLRPEPPRWDIEPIDAFVLARGAATGLTPAPEADRTALIRRLSLDLIGLPPTLAEVDAFVADPAPDAYDRLVDRLLSSPHYGERWARPWLDLARYGDTDGFNFDRKRSMWRWRDQVIEALNRDQPFDQFTVEQLAGDLLPEPTEQQRIATGFHRNTMLNDEGGVDPDEARHERLLDRASTTATVWLGSTLACAQCHDHKYDPFTQRDFYALVAFFETQDEVTLELPTSEQRERRAALQRELAELEQRNAKAAEIAAAKKKLQAAPIDTTLVLRERDGAVAATHLRVRGSYDHRGPLVEAAVPASLHRWPDGAPKNRLGLARWLVSPDNPLVARVHVNRLWDTLFGRPLVATPDDFGTQAPPVEQPELLDWLASEFVRLGWRQKELLRTIVRSATYRRSAKVTAAQLAVDPDNRFLLRGSRYRLEGEAIRDCMLVASGLLCDTIGGPSVFPLQADTSGVIALNKTDVSWRPSPVPERHRRALYTFWRRTMPFVALAAFDVPSREVCTARRARTNTPLQALVGLNDPASFAAAVALGERMALAAGSVRDRLAYGFRLCTQRPATAAELDRLEQAFGQESPAQSWTMVANALLNLDETLTRQ